VEVSKAKSPKRKAAVTRAGAAASDGVVEVRESKVPRRSRANRVAGPSAATSDTVVSLVDDASPVVVESIGEDDVIDLS